MTNPPPAPSHTDSASFELLCQVPQSIAIARHKALLLVVWRKLGSAGVGELAAAAHRMQQSVDGHWSALHVVQAGVGLPNSATRNALIELTSQPDLRIQAVAAVFGIEGFLGSAIRSLATSVLLAQRHPLPLGFHHTVREAAEWLARMHRQGHASVIHVDAVTTAFTCLTEGST